ncbi:xylulokinase [Thalassobacillus sp. B23F22_16]|uniref:xylulokinase n=1 Tax=Thalassobacillus sp. B23F22_16 TaxID=3459513 RepID=UPI00373F5384
MLLGIDVGTQGAKVLVIDENANIIETATTSYDFQTPQPGWTEQHPNLWWESICEALKQLKVDLKKVTGIGVSGQMHSLVILDNERQVIRPAILWNDLRTEEECRKIEGIVGKEKIYHITRNAVLPGFTAPKLQWIKNHEPEKYAQIDIMMQPKDYIGYKLTDSLACDVSDASGTAWFNLERRNWSEEILSLLDIPAQWLPKVNESQEIVGYVTKEAAEITGLPEGIPLVAGAGDNAAAALGNGIYQQGKVSISVGTSGTVFTPLENVPAVEGESLETLHLFCHCIPDTWHAMGVTLSAGMSLKWFLDSFQIDSYEELLEGVDEVAEGSDGLIFLPYLNGERTPHNDAKAKGTFIGIGYQHKREHFVRAILEGVSFSMRDCLELIKKLDVKIDHLYVTGGASKSKVWRDILSSILHERLYAFEEREGPAFGAALLAGLGTKVWGGTDQLPDCFDQGEKTNPKKSNRYDEYYSVYQQSYAQVKPLFQSLSQLSEHS